MILPRRKGGLSMVRSLAWLTALILALSMFPAFAAGAVASTPLEDADAPRGVNVLLAARAVNQFTLSSGETFSFNAVVGPRTEQRGYVPALNGRGAEVIGGGVGQAAATLYLALMQLEPGTVRFDALSVYGDRYNQSYVSDGSLAVLVDYNTGTDFCFTNLTAGDMILEMWPSAGSLCCSISLTNGEEWASSDSAANAGFIAGQSRSAPPRSTLAADSCIRCGDDENQQSNITLAADSICDTTLLTGDVFSFNAVVGPREERCGYLPALNGRGAEVVGGGVGQVASAVWLAIRSLPDVSIVEKSTYGQRYNQSYVDSSADAILIDYNAGVDFAFRYTGSGSLTLYTWVDDGALYCEIYLSQ